MIYVGFVVGTKKVMGKKIMMISTELTAHEFNDTLFKGNIDECEDFVRKNRKNMEV